MNQIPNIEEEFDARSFIKKARKQNWKNGGVLAYDDEELVEELEDTFHQQLQKARHDGYNAGLADGTDKPLLAIEQMLQKAREQRKGWKGYVAVDPQAGHYKYSPVFSDRKGAELWVKGKEISGLEVVEVDILLADHSELDQDKK